MHTHIHINITIKPIKINNRIIYMCVILHFDQFYIFQSKMQLYEILVTINTFYAFRFDYIIIIIIIITRVTRIVTDAMYLCYSYMKAI